MVVATHNSITALIRLNQFGIFLVEDHENIAVSLMEHGANIHVQDKNGLSPLHIAARGGFENLVNLLIHKRSDVNLRDRFGKTPLHWAAENGKLK